MCVHGAACGRCATGQGGGGWSAVGEAAGRSVRVSVGASVCGCKYPCVHEHPCALERSSREGIGQQGGPGTRGRLQDRTKPPFTRAAGRRLERDLVGGLGCQIRLHPKVKF